jgi:hypothetical protein
VRTSVPQCGDFTGLIVAQLQKQAADATIIRLGAGASVRSETVE